MRADDFIAVGTARMAVATRRSPNRRTSRCSGWPSWPAGRSRSCCRARAAMSCSPVSEVPLLGRTTRADHGAQRARTPSLDALGRALPPGERGRGRLVRADERTGARRVSNPGSAVHPPRTPATLLEGMASHDVGAAADGAIWCGACSPRLPRWLPDNLLERGDRMSMAASLELRPRFSTVDSSSSPSRCPHRSRSADGSEVGGEGARPSPPSAGDRRSPKVGFRVPLDSWFRTGLRRTFARDRADRSRSRWWAPDGPDRDRPTARRPRPRPAQRGDPHLDAPQPGDVGSVATPARRGRVPGVRLVNPVTAFPGDPPSYVCFSGQDWWYFSRAHSDFQLMLRIAVDRPVLFVNSITMRMPLPGKSSRFLCGCGARH